MRKLSAIMIGLMLHAALVDARQTQKALDWEAVKAIPVETLVRLTFVDGAAAEGTLVGVELDDIVLRDVRPLKGRFMVRDVGGNQAFGRQNLAKVEPQAKAAPAKKMSGSTKAVIWGAVGVAAALLIWAGVEHAICPEC